MSNNIFKAIDGMDEFSTSSLEFPDYFYDN